MHISLLERPWCYTFSLLLKLTRPVEGGTQDFLENIRNELPDGNEVSGRVM